MVMNKKGFLKILEAIIAIVVVLGFVVAIIPEREKAQARLPPDLEQTINSILKEMQENVEFRECVLNGNTDGLPSLEISITSDYPKAECVYDYIQYITRPTEIHPWIYAVRICEGIDTSCNYYVNDEAGDITLLPGNKNVYIKSVALSVPDVAEGTIAEGVTVEPGIISTLTIFAWSKE